ncbi:MAG: hypothetical protein MZV64_20825 [Ignavibacteriales bacterium]|nr:hypothetical protein [Ignavibacteriales bacterium]
MESEPASSIIFSRGKSVTGVFSIRYLAGMEAFNYCDETIYDKMKGASLEKAEHRAETDPGVG